MHSGVDGGREEIVGGSNGVDVTCQMQVELFHGDDLAVATTRCPTFDAEGRALAGLADAGEYFLAKMCAQCLTEANGCCGFTFAERGRGYGRNHRSGSD